MPLEEGVAVCRVVQVCGLHLSTVRSTAFDDWESGVTNRGQCDLSFARVGSRSIVCAKRKLETGIPFHMTDHNQVSVRNRLMFLLALVFISRLLAALVILGFDGAASFGSPDTATYVGLAASLVHGSFSSNGVPDVVRTPGYPLLLVPAVASYHPTLIALFENLLLATVSAWLIWKIVREIAPFSKAWVWAVLLYCFEPVGFLIPRKFFLICISCGVTLFSMAHGRFSP